MVIQTSTMSQNSSKLKVSDSHDISMEGNPENKTLFVHANLKGV